MLLKLFFNLVDICSRRHVENDSDWTAVVDSSTSDERFSFCMHTVLMKTYTYTYSEVGLHLFNMQSDLSLLPYHLWYELYSLSSIMSCVKEVFLIVILFIQIFLNLIKFVRHKVKVWALLIVMELWFALTKRFTRDWIYVLFCCMIP